jgi:hypothetical protein
MARTVLFSNSVVASYLNRNFECAWESVRPVPTLTLDFGNGEVITRTLHGNIATYICTEDGYVVDILPALYKPQAYLSSLRIAQTLASHMNGEDKGQLSKQLASYHVAEADRLVRYDKVPAKASQPFTYGLNKPGSPRALEKMPGEVKEAVKISDLLAQDTQFNDHVRRRAVHSRLASMGLIRPADIKNWLYREVLHADLDDPYLGLRPLLSANNPFESQQESRQKSQP